MEVGGVELRLLEVAREMQQHGIVFDVAALSGVRGALADDLEALGGRIWMLQMDARMPFRLRRLIRDNRYSIVHSHVATASGFFAWLAAASGPVQTRIVHGRSEGDGRPDSVRRRVQRCVLRWMVRRFATHVRGVSPASLDFVYGARWESDPRAKLLFDPVDPKRLVDTNGPELHSILGLPSNRKIAMHVGRSDSAKNRERLPGIIRACLDANLDVQLVLVGQMDEEEGHLLRRLSQKSGLGSRISFLGQRKDVVSLLRQADVLLLPSRREGLPGVVLEALGVGTPVVSSDNSGAMLINAVLGHVSTVSLLRPNVVWADAIREALHHPPSPELRLEAVELIEKSPFSMHGVVAEYLDLYS